MRTLIIVALASLAACAPKAVAPPPAPPTKASVSDYRQDIDGHGAEPLWALSIRGTTLILTRPGQPPLTALAPGAVIQPGEAAWTGKLADGRALKVVLYASPCSEGASSHAYPFSAEVDPPGESPLNGCADRARALAKTP